MQIILTACLAFFALLFFPGVGIGETAQKKTAIGLAEDVTLLPWGVKIPARIDTGAATSSLDARELKIEGDIADFKLPDKYGGLNLRLPIVDWRVVRNADSRERRPVVEMEICMGAQTFRARMNLNDRSRVKYPLIIGRNVLRNHFIVDCMRAHCAPPCPEGPPK